MSPPPFTEVIALAVPAPAPQAPAGAPPEDPRALDNAALEAVAAAAVGGHLAVARWLQTLGIHGDTAAFVDAAAARGS